MFISPAVAAEIQKGTVETRFCVWIDAKDRLTGESKPGGIHSGLDLINFAVNGQPRTYYGAGQLLNIGVLNFEEGLNVQTQTIDIAIKSPEAIEKIKYHEVRYRPIQLHVAFLNANGAVIDTIQLIDGWIDSVQETEDKEEYKATLEIVSNTRAGTKTLALKRSHEGMKRRNPNDMFNQYAATSGQGSRFWGMHSSRDNIKSDGSGGRTIEKLGKDVLSGSANK